MRAGGIDRLAGGFLKDDVDVLGKPVTDICNLLTANTFEGHWKSCSQTNNNIFYEYQYGFRNNHSTDLFLSFLNDKILKGFDNGVYSGIILIDLQKRIWYDEPQNCAS